MRYVLKLVMLAVFSVAATLMVGCGDTATKDTKPADDKDKTENASNADSDSDSSPAVTVSKVTFDVTGMS